MIHNPWSITFLSVAVLTAGCNKQPTASEQLDKAATETKAAAQDMKEYTFAQKSEFVAKIRQYPKNWAPPQSNRGNHEDSRNGNR